MSATPALAVSQNGCPGRGILFGITENGRYAVIAYFITEKSKRLQDCALLPDGDDVTLAPLGVQEAAACHLVQTLGGITFVGNDGDTDALCRMYQKGKSFSQAVFQLPFSSNKPLCFPRIFGMLALNDTGVSYTLSVLKSAQGEPRSVERFLFDYPEPLAGRGHLICSCRGDNLRSGFLGEPRPVQIQGSLQAFGDSIWEALDPQSRISLFTRRICIATGVQQTRIINRYYRTPASSDEVSACSDNKKT